MSPVDEASTLPWAWRRLSGNRQFGQQRPPSGPRHHSGPHPSAMRMTGLSGLPIAFGA
jgi:hypothetical protein